MAGWVSAVCTPPPRPAFHSNPAHAAAAPEPHAPNHLDVTLRASRVCCTATATWRGGGHCAAQGDITHSHVNAVDTGAAHHAHSPKHAAVGGLAPPPTPPSLPWHWLPRAAAAAAAGTARSSATPARCGCASACSAAGVHHQGGEQRHGQEPRRPNHPRVAHRARRPTHTHKGGCSRRRRTTRTHTLESSKRLGEVLW